MGGCKFHRLQNFQIISCVNAISNFYLPVNNFNSIHPFFYNETNTFASKTSKLYTIKLYLIDKS